MEPQYPGVAEDIVNLGECWDKGLLKEHTDEIIRLTGECNGRFQRAYRYLSACGSLDGDTSKVVLENVNIKKLEGYTAGVAKRLFGKARRDKGSEKTWYLSAISPDGILFFEDTISLLCPDIYYFDDEFGVVSGLILSSLRRYALESGYDIISCYCSMSPLSRIEHLLIPALGTAFITASSWHMTKAEPFRRIHARRFTDSQAISRRRQRISFNRKAQRELLAEAVANLSEARKLRGSLKKIYAQSMDFSAVDKITGSLTDRILGGR